MTDARSPMRALRAALFAAVCVALAAVGHSSLSGHDLPGSVLALAFAVSGGAAWLAGARRRGTLSIGTGLVTVQGALHLLFAGSDGHSAPQGAGRTGHSAGGSHTTDMHSTVMPMGVDPMGMDHMAADLMAAGTFAGLGADVAGSTGMLLAHLVGAAVCAFWLARGEAAFFRLARTVGTLAFSPLRLLLAVVRVPEPPHAVRPRPRTPRRLHGVVLAHALSRRGPPGRPLTRATAPGALV
ncbi:hypothetical protein [Streptomyces formicae]|uniref:Integral-membrane protein n=1 Tax=Streptomyces formicae TaxID=1616117 RepID=A0ABY3WSR8_9ACTN|nr:hypothetical protein [Streptomyces formicae]UNM14700.1 hypothetical protein J4032_27455 [Streptomyces formicae]